MLSDQTNSSLYIHGHSCLEIRTKTLSLVCDPWLLGSTYWRSWWNFPESPDFESLLDIWSKKENLYIYITHLHWDHFHGPTLRRLKKLCVNCKFIIPKTPEKRLRLDLESVVGKKNIIEINHAQKFQLTKKLSILSFQVGPFLTDSILSINSPDFNILNINDSKIFRLSLSHLLSLIPKPDYVLRSHSSANDRCCYRDLNGNYPNIKIDKTSSEYSREFFDSCYQTGASFAIPFASNMACLHKETFKYNSILNFSDYVFKDFKSVKEKYSGMDCILILPSEHLVLETNTHNQNKLLREKLNNESREMFLNNYQEKISPILQKQYYLEDNTKVSLKKISNYFSKIINSTPFLLKKYLNDKIILEIFSKEEINYFQIDFNLGKVKEIFVFPKGKDFSKIRISSYVINDVCQKSHWNSVGVSKRLEVWTNPNNKRYLVFNYLCNTIESGGIIPIRNIFNYRFLSIWLTRYREILDWVIYLAKLNINKAPKFY